MSKNFSVNENKCFAESVLFHSSVLDDAVGWIQSNMDIGDVFEESDVVNYVRQSRLEPGDLFDDEVLVEWAEKNDFVRFYS